MKYVKFLTLTLVFMLAFTSCKKQNKPQETTPQQPTVEINLSDKEITVDGKPIDKSSKNAVYTANDIIYYQDGKDNLYGEGSENDAHSQKDADAHTVLHVSKPGTYKISGKLSRGQIAVDLGEDAKSDPDAVVTLVLNGADITCEVAPAIIFYNVYECGNSDTDKATKDVDTSAAGANIVIADGTTNTVNGSYVAKIYDPESIVLAEDGKSVEDADKLHKYDGTVYSKMSMNVSGEKKNSGILNINAKNEGLDTELHLTINGGNINIISGNDGINTNEDEVSVTTLNGGNLNIKVTGETGEGDGIDSNGWLVINGGSLASYACSTSGDAGIDSDMGIHINGGTVIATGNMLDRIQRDGQNYAVFNFANKQNGGKSIEFKDEQNKNILSHTPQNDYSILIFSSPDLKAGNYTLWCDDNQMQGSSTSFMGGHGAQPPTARPNDESAPLPEHSRPEGYEPPQHKPVHPDNINPGEDFKPSKDDTRPEKNEGIKPQTPETQETAQEKTKEFKIIDGENMFSFIELA